MDTIHVRIMLTQSLSFRRVKVSQKNRRTTKSITKKKKQKVRGFWVSFFLVIIIVQGILATVLFDIYRTDATTLDRPIVLGLMIIHSLANIAAAVGIWFWKRWALYLYAASTILAIIVGLITVGMWSMFSLIFPFVILAWLLQEKWDYFE